MVKMIHPLPSQGVDENGGPTAVENTENGGQLQGAISSKNGNPEVQSPTSSQRSSNRSMSLLQRIRRRSQCDDTPPPATTRLRTQEIERIQGVFNTLDVDKSGKLTLENIRLVLKLLDTDVDHEQLVQALDQDGSGDVSFEEFLPFAAKLLREAELEAKQKRKNERQAKKGKADKPSRSVNTSMDQDDQICRDSVSSAVCAQREEYEELLETGRFADDIGAQEQRNSVHSSVFMNLHQIRRAFQVCDVDGSGHISRDELRITLKKLGYLIKDEELDELMQKIDKNGSGTIDYQEFLEAFCSDDFKKYNCTINRLCQLPTFLKYNVPITISEQKAALQRMTHVERLGAIYLKRQHKNKETQYRKQSIKQGLTENIQSRRVQANDLDEQDRKHLRALEWRAIFWAVKMTASTNAQRLRTWHIPHTAGVSHYHRLLCARKIAGAMSAVIAFGAEMWGLQFQQEEWVYRGIIAGFTVVASAVEIFVMYSTALCAAIEITKITKLSLWPVDDDRAFVMAALSRAALQIGNPRNKIKGVNPMKGVPRWKVILATLVYHGSRSVVNFLIRLFMKRVIWRAAAKSLLELMALPVNAIMNAMVMDSVLRQSRTCAFGPSAGVEVLDDVFVSEVLSLECRLLMIKGVGCTVVGKGEMHPNIEVILRYLHQQYDIARGATDPILDECGELDDLDDLCSQLEKSEEALRVNVVIAVVLAIILDGGLNKGDRKLYQRVVNSCNLPVNWSAIQILESRFLRGIPLRMTDLREAVTCVSHTDVNTTRLVTLRKAFNRVIDFLAC